MINYSKFNYVFVLLTLLVFSCQQNKSLRDAKTVPQAKEAVDGFVRGYVSAYGEMCDKPRNDALKAEYRVLSDAVRSLYGCGRKAVNLSYEEQFEVNDYAEQKLNEHPDLKSLSEGTINCW